MSFKSDQLEILLGVYDHYFQASFSLKQLCLSKSNFMWSLLEKEGLKFIKKMSRSHDEDGHHAHIWPEPKLTLIWFNRKNHNKAVPLINIMMTVTKTRQCNIQQYFMAVKMFIFR